MKTRVLLDAFHHMMPGHRIGSNIVVGGYQTNYGRYTPGDCYHPNGIAWLQADLAAQYDFQLLNAPYSEMSLFDADILFAANPDYPLYPGASPYRWTPQDVDALLAFAHRGGGVLLLVNSFLSRPDYWEENFDIERVSLLFDRLGLRWDPNYMSDDQTIELAHAGDFKIGYGQGGRVWEGALPPGATPLITKGDYVYGFEMAIGSGKLVVLGDAGMVSNGLVCFPGFDNAVFVQDVLAKLTPRWCQGTTPSWDIYCFGHVSAAPSAGGLNEALLRSLRPDAQWMEDHHYRHLSWNHKSLAEEQTAWAQLPVAIEKLRDATEIPAPLNWARLDSDDAGPEVEVNLTISTLKREGATELHLIGRVESTRLSWGDLCSDAGQMKVAGEIEKAHLVFEMKLVLDDQNHARCARWSQGQIIYARSHNAVHYGYEIILNSQSGAIVPRAS